MSDYLTDAEKTVKEAHGVQVAHYRYFLRFSLKGRTLTRWFSSPDSRMAFIILMTPYIGSSYQEGEV